MTTVAADARTGVMAADTAVTDGEIRTRMRKIERVGDSLVGVAGDVSEIEKWLKWFRGGRRGTGPKTATCAALVLDKKGITHYLGTKEMSVAQDYMAIGTGAMAALAVLHAGLDCQRAVEIACEIDAQSCAPIQLETL